MGWIPKNQPGSIPGSGGAGSMFPHSINPGNPTCPGCPWDWEGGHGIHPRAGMGVGIMGWIPGTIPAPSHSRSQSEAEGSALLVFPHSINPRNPGCPRRAGVLQAGISCPNPGFPAAGMGGGIMGWIPGTKILSWSCGTHKIPITECWDSQNPILEL